MRAPICAPADYVAPATTEAEADARTHETLERMGRPLPALAPAPVLLAWDELPPDETQPAVWGRDALFVAGWEAGYVDGQFDVRTHELPHARRTAEDHAPRAHDLVRAPLTQADDYTPVPASTHADTWNYEAAQDVADASPVAVAWRTMGAADTEWTRAVGRRRGNVQQAVVVRRTRAGRVA